MCRFLILLLFMSIGWKIGKNIYEICTCWCDLVWFHPNINSLTLCSRLLFYILEHFFDERNYVMFKKFECKSRNTHYFITGAGKVQITKYQLKLTPENPITPIKEVSTGFMECRYIAFKLRIYFLLTVKRHLLAELQGKLVIWRQRWHGLYLK